MKTLKITYENVDKFLGKFVVCGKYGSIFQIIKHIPKSENVHEHILIKRFGNEDLCQGWLSDDIRLATKEDCKDVVNDRIGFYKSCIANIDREIENLKQKREKDMSYVRECINDYKKFLKILNG